MAGIAVSASAPSVAVLMTCFNRRELTLKCLEALFSQKQIEPRTIKLILVDDGSTDGTAAAVRNAYPEAQVIEGLSNLYWNGGMRVAFGEAIRQDHDFYLWLNDDTLLVPQALDVLLKTSRELAQRGIDAIVTASTNNAETGELSYGGSMQIKGLIRRELAPLEPSAVEPLPCDTMNGNCTLIPRAVVARIGNLEPTFTHAFGDLDYGFRARSAGFSVYIAPGFLGTCSDNTRQNTWRDQQSTFRKRWKHLNSVKGSPFPEWALYCRRHLGPFWMLYAISPYIKTLSSLIRK